MVPLSPNNLIVRARAVDLLTGETQELTIKNERSTFFEPFKCGVYQVQLRLDWKDPDNQGNPMLDADFKHPNTGKHDKLMRTHPTHHTQAQIDGKRIYQWVFEDEQRKLLQVEITWSISLNSAVCLTDECTNVLTRAGVEIP